jgi:hypothetical protein
LHAVTLLERDELRPAADVESAADAAFRWTARQVVQPHTIMARCRELLREHLPDIYAALLAAGVAEAPLATQTLHDTSEWPGDEQLTMLMTRRSTFDWVLIRATLNQRGITLRCGVQITGLLAANHRQRGLRSAVSHTSVAITASCQALRCRALPQAASSPRSTNAPSASRVPITVPCNLLLHRSARSSVPHAPRPRGPHRRPAHRADLRGLARWSRTHSPVFPMAGLHNTLRRLVVNGLPVVTGLHAIGDSVCTTNPTLGRGLTLALSGALDLVSVVRAHPDDWSAQALALDRLVGEHVAPFYEDQAVIDSARLAVLRRNILATPTPEPPVVDGSRVTYAQLRSAAQFDSTAFRAFWLVMGMLRLPDDVYSDRAVVSATVAALETHGAAPAMPQPTREELSWALAITPRGEFGRSGSITRWPGPVP